MALDQTASSVGGDGKKSAWPPLESNPEAFTALARQLGLQPGYEFVDVFGLDPDLLMMVPQPCLAVVVLFPTQCQVLEDFRKKQKETIGVAGRETEQKKSSEDYVYVHQYVGNACGTFALCHALWNNQEALDAASPLLRFLADAMSEITKEQDNNSTGPAEKPLAALLGEAFMNFNDVREKHAAIASDARLNQTAELAATAKVEEHFTAFVRKSQGGSSSRIVELDGRLRVALEHEDGKPEADLLHSVAPLIQKNFFDVAAGSENNFAVLALVKT
ncbi:unnamed protein product [Amoebophrya sp. A25]|nr:unnamed protein product [Amoebophrya sp. A25]|eukprot:GSA25T00012681001.1